MRAHRNDSQEQIVRLLQALRPVPPRDPEMAAQRRAAFVQACQRASLQRQPAFRPHPRLRLAAMLVGLVLVIISSTGLVVSASQTSLPGDALYPIKLAAEQVGIALSLGPSTRSQRLVERAVRRAQELDLLALGAPDRVTPEEIARFERHLAVAQQHARALAPDQAPLAEALLQQLQEAAALKQRAMRRIQGEQPPAGPHQPGPANPPANPPVQNPTDAVNPAAPPHNRRGLSDEAPLMPPPTDTPAPPGENVSATPATSGGASPNHSPGPNATSPGATGQPPAAGGPRDTQEPTPSSPNAGGGQPVPPPPATNHP